MNKYSFTWNINLLIWNLKIARQEKVFQKKQKRIKKIFLFLS